MTTNPADLIKPPVVVPRDDPHDKFVTTLKPVSYTHLTLPTKRIV